MDIKTIMALFVVFATIGAASATPSSYSDVTVSGGVVTVHSGASNNAYQQAIASNGVGTLVGLGTIGTTGMAGSEYNNFMDRTRWTQVGIDMTTTNVNSELTINSGITAGLSDSQVDSYMRVDLTQNLFLPLEIASVTGATFDQSGVGADNEVNYNTGANAVLDGAGWFAIPTTYVYGISHASTEVDTGVAGTNAGDVTEIGHREVFTGGFVNYNFFDVFGP